GWGRPPGRPGRARCAGRARPTDRARHARATEARRAAHTRRERTVGAAERGREAAGGVAPAGGPAPVPPAPRRRARSAEQEPRAVGAERLCPAGPDAGAPAAEWLRPAVTDADAHRAATKIGDDDACGGSLPHGRREASGEGARCGRSRPLRPDRRVPRPPAP